MSASGDLARSVADAHARKTLAALRLRKGSVTVGDRTYPNSWAEGKAYRLVVCAVCEDTGVILGEHDEFLGYCDRCPTGEAHGGGAT